ncbi:hypothetical protein MBANPS3_008732 [Mucor bainieri]
MSKLLVLSLACLIQLGCVLAICGGFEKLGDDLVALKYSTGGSWKKVKTCNPSSWSCKWSASSTQVMSFSPPGFIVEDNGKSCEIQEPKQKEDQK